MWRKKKLPCYLKCEIFRTRPRVLTRAHTGKQIRKKATEGQFHYVPKQDPDIYTAYPQLIEFLSHEGMRFINKNGRVFCGADSVYQIYRRLRWSRYIAWIYVVPGIHRICKIAYFIIAKNRYRLGQTKCDSDVCNID